MLLSRSFQSVTRQRTAKKFRSRFYNATAKRFLRFYRVTAEKFLRFPGLKLKRPEISRKKNFFFRTQKEVLARAISLGCTKGRFNFLTLGFLFSCSSRPRNSANVSFLKEPSRGLLRNFDRRQNYL